MKQHLLTRDHTDDIDVAGPVVRRARRPESSTSAPDSARPRRRTRRLAVLAGAAFATLLFTGCGPATWSAWVPDFNGDGQISQSEADQQVARIAADLEAQRRAVQNDPFLTCVRHHESDRGAAPYIGGYGAENPSSSASGAYQFIDSTWRTVSARAGHGGYARAVHAPWWVQDAVAMYLVNTGGKSAWAGSGC
jgi:hypothetical protein